MMEKIRVNLQKKIDDSYDLVIGSNLFSAIADGLLNLKIGKVAIITDSNVKELYGGAFLSVLKEKGLDAILVSFSPGEISKNRTTKDKIEDILIKAGIRRDGLIIALGGGVVGDLAGFIASTYMRGIPYIQLPTTLLAMVDSSIGGKTGVDTELGKNLIGSFYQPKKVFMDVSVLKTLARGEMLNGLVEMIKHSVIADKKFFIFLGDYAEDILSLKEDTIVKAILWSSKIKKSIVENDEKESSLRMALNFGHTIGHSVEKLSNYSLGHGHAVALGIIAETKIAEEMGIINSVDSGKIISLIEKVGFNRTLGSLDINEIIENTSYDKKSFDGKVKYALPSKVGEIKINVEVDKDIAAKVLGDMH